MVVDETPTSNILQSPETVDSTRKVSYKTPSAEPAYASFIFPDIKALHEIRLELCVDLEYQEITVHGFEIYVVEQWAAERKLSTVITSYTGNSQDTIHAVQVILPKDPERWPGRFKEYYKDLSVFSKARVMPKGSLFITNLASVPSTLNLLHVGCGDVRAIWRDFKVNFNLKRLRCLGRSALLVGGTSTAAEDKFGQLYKISIFSSDRQAQLKELEQSEHFPNIERNYHPVIELTTLVQTCLYYFNLYHSPKDGLLCYKTEAALGQFWAKLAKSYFGVERPKNEGISGTTTVAALISLVLSCYYKLQVEDCISSKDPFEEDEFFSAIYSFQKKHGITRGTNPVYLDDLTLQKLFEVSAKTSNSDIFKFKKVVKSTVSDITGRGNPMHLCNEILTADLDTMVRNIHGGSIGLLWKGKGRLRKNFYKGYDNFCDIKFSRGNPDLFLERQAAEASSDGSDSQESSLLADQEKHVFDNNFGRYSTSSSSVSASSMLCNYDKAAYSPSYGINKSYHDEYFRRNSLPLLPDGTHDPVIEPKKDHQKAYGLYRSNSLAEVQEAVEQWNLPFDCSLVRMARDLLKINNLVQCQERDEKEGRNLDRSNEVYHAGHDDDDDLDVDFGRLIGDLQSYRHAANNKVKKLEDNNKEVEKKQAFLSGEMKALSSLTSKFKYDMGILDVRMRDVEESISQFDQKLIAVQKLIVDQGLGTALGTELLVDKQQLEKCLGDFLEAENTKYEGVFCKMCSKKYFKQLHNDVKIWTSWIFDKFFNKNTELTENKENI